MLSLGNDLPVVEVAVLASDGGHCLATPTLPVLGAMPANAPTHDIVCLLCDERLMAHHQECQVDLRVIIGILGTLGGVDSFALRELSS